MLSLLIVLASVIFLDVILSGDNAVVVGMAANTLPESQRNFAIIYGMTLAATARIILSLFAVALLHYRFISIIGGLSLFWVAYKLGRSIYKQTEPGAPPPIPQGKALLATIGIIAVADISMSLDNVLAVAGIARHNPFVMVLGLIFSIACLAYASKLVSGLLEKFKWLNWAGVGLIIVVALELVFGIKAI